MVKQAKTNNRSIDRPRWIDMVSVIAPTAVFVSLLFDATWHSLFH